MPDAKVHIRLWLVIRFHRIILVFSKGPFGRDYEPRLDSHILIVRGNYPLRLAELYPELRATSMSLDFPNFAISATLLARCPFVSYSRPLS